MHSVASTTVLSDGDQKTVSRVAMYMLSLSKTMIYEGASNFVCAADEVFLIQNILLQWFQAVLSAIAITQCYSHVPPVAM